MMGKFCGAASPLKDDVYLLLGESFDQCSVTAEEKLLVMEALSVPNASYSFL